MDNVKTPSVMFIAGDPSGDQHSAPVIKSLAGKCPNVKTYGIGGPAMAQAGFQSVLPFEKFNCMGYVEVIKHLPFFLGAKKKLIKMMKAQKPDALVCVDYSGFNMPMMKAAAKLNIPVIWYIAPMVWAWKGKRAKILGDHASHIAVIFPFEVPYFSPFKAPVTFVGNPLTESLPNITGADKKISADNSFRLAIIPGSRHQEIKNMLPVMLEAAGILKKEHPQLKVTVSKFKGVDQELFEAAACKGFDFFDGKLSQLLTKSDLALVTSGTASLETALMGVPMVITYRTSALSYKIYKRFVKIPYIGLPNIIAQSEIVPECIQNDATAQNLADKLNRFIKEPARREECVTNLSTLRAKLGEKTPSTEAANIIYSYIGQGL